MVCQKKHWKVGGHRAECATLAAAAAVVTAVGDETEGDGTSMAEGKGDEAGGGPLAGAASSGDGGERKKKKKGVKKGKKGKKACG